MKLVACDQARTCAAGAALLDLTASAPGSSFLNNGLPTILVSFTVGCATGQQSTHVRLWPAVGCVPGIRPACPSCWGCVPNGIWAWSCRAPSTVKATQATTGKTVANAISGVISGFGGYGLNNPTVVSFVNCTACAAPASTAQAGSGGVQATSVATVTPQLSYYTLTMTFAYNPGFTFAGLSGLFYAAFKASLYQVEPPRELHSPAAAAPQLRRVHKHTLLPHHGRQAAASAADNASVSVDTRLPGALLAGPRRWPCPFAAAVSADGSSCWPVRRLDRAGRSRLGCQPSHALKRVCR